MSINELRTADRDDDQRIMPTLGEAATSTLVSMLVLSTAMSQGAFAQAGDDDNSDGGPAADDPFDGAEMIDGSVALPTLVVVGDGEARNIQTRPAPLTRIPTSVQDTPQLINVIGEQTMEERADTSLSDVMRNVPGVTMNAGEGGGSTPRGDNFNIRGFSAQGDIFVDGVRDIGIYNRDVFNLEEVDVFKGAAGAYFGRGSGGGSINLKTKTPKRDFFADWAVTLGTDAYYRTALDVNLPVSDGVAMRVNAMGLDREFAERDRAFQERWGIAPSIAFGMDGPTTLTLTYLHQEEDGLPDTGVPNFNNLPVIEQSVPRTNYYGFTDDFAAMRADVATATLEHRFNEHVSVSNVTRVGDYWMDRQVVVMEAGGLSACATLAPGCAMPPGGGGPGGTPGYAHASKGLEGTTYQNQTTLAADFATGFLSHEVRAALDLSREDYDQFNYGLAGSRPALDVFAPAFAPSGQARSLSSVVETRADTIGVSLYDRVHLGHGFYAIGSARVENYEVNATQLSPTGLVTDQGTQDETLTTFQGALQYKPAENQTYYVSASTAELPPFSPGAGYYNSLGDLGRAPEEVVSYEAGGKVTVLDGFLGLGASVFRIERTNMRTEVDPITGVEVLDGERVVQGVELQADGRLTDRWTITAGYAYLDSEVVDPGAANDGNRMALVPQHSGSIWTTYEPIDGLTLGGGATFVGKRFVNDNEDRYLPAHWQLDAMVAYRFNERFELQLNALNLTNEITYERSHGARQMVPGAGRTFLLTGKATF